MSTEHDPQFNTKLLQVICQLHEWENQHLHLVQSQAGRYLYLSLVKQLIEEKRDQPSALLKGIYHNQDLSERALRYKIREFEEEGLIKFEANQVDKRSKKLCLPRTYYRPWNPIAMNSGAFSGQSSWCFPKNSLCLNPSNPRVLYEHERHHPNSLVEFVTVFLYRLGNVCLAQSQA